VDAAGRLGRRERSPQRGRGSRGVRGIGYRTRATKLLAVLDRSKHPHVPPLSFHIYKLFFLCELLGGDAETSHETEAVAFFPEHELPALSISRTTPEQVALLFKHRRCPELPADFD